eukprot:13085723-Heterocapsa_arctica.AAC.1
MSMVLSVPCSEDDPVAYDDGCERANTSHNLSDAVESIRTGASCVQSVRTGGSSVEDERMVKIRCCDIHFRHKKKAAGKLPRMRAHSSNSNISSEAAENF